MKPIKMIFSFTIVIMMSACSSGGGQSGTNNAQGGKSLFSQWSNSSLSLDMTSMTFGSSATVYWVINTGICRSTVVINGTNSAGNVQISGSTWTGTGGHGDPGCGTLNDTYSYTNDGANLTICSQGCEVFQ